jgi:hypothetical protein
MKEAPGESSSTKSSAPTLTTAPVKHSTAIATAAQAIDLSMQQIKLHVLN